MFSKTMTRRPSLCQQIMQIPKRKSSTGNGDLLQNQAKTAQISHQQDLSFLAPTGTTLFKQQAKPRLISHMHELSSLAHPALANTSYPPISPQNLEVQAVKRNDAKQTEEILELFLDQFMFDEPLSQNLNFSRADAEPIYRAIIEACSQDSPSVSLLVRDSTANNRLVGVLLNHLLSRDQPAPNLYANKDYSPNVREFCKILHVCESSIWDILPKNINLVCNNVFMSVRRDYARMGIGQQMVELSELNVQQMEGVQAAVGELSSIGTQKIYERLGYRTLLSIPYTSWVNEQGKPIVKAKDGADSLKLVGKFYCFN